MSTIQTTLICPYCEYDEVHVVYALIKPEDIAFWKVQECPSCNGIFKFKHEIRTTCEYFGNEEIL